MSFEIHTTDIVVDTLRFVKGDPLKMVARRYSTSASPSRDGLTLLFLHGTGNHKEHWEPTIDRLFQHKSENAGDNATSIREIWALDSQTHGDSAVLNATAFAEPFSRASQADWAIAIADFVNTRLASHRVICIGHSGGALALLYSTSFWTSPASIPYECMVLVEPGIVDLAAFIANPRDRKRVDGLVKILNSRKNEWDSHEAAYAWFRQRVPWNSWDPRIVRIFAYKGLRPLQPGATKVTTKCDKAHEAQNLTEQIAMFQAVPQIERVCNHVPIHVIFGEQNDFVLSDAKASVTDVSKGRNVASVSIVPGTGHMLVQQNPDRLADILQGILKKSQPRRSVEHSNGTFYSARL